MGTDRADLRCGFSHYDMATVAAFPNLDAALFEDFLYLNVVQKCTVPLLVVFLDSCYSTEFLSQLRESYNNTAILLEAVLGYAPQVFVPHPLRQELDIYLLSLVLHGKRELGMQNLAAFLTVTVRVRVPATAPIAV